MPAGSPQQAADSAADRAAATGNQHPFHAAGPGAMVTTVARPSSNLWRSSSMTNA
jgi:hypothetical protein